MPEKKLPLSKRLSETKAEQQPPTQTQQLQPSVPQQQLQQSQPSPQQPAPRQLTITLPAPTISFDETVKAKLPFLVLLLLLFSFSLVMFGKANFHTLDLVDLSRLEYNLPKLYSVSFILFILLYGAAFGVAMFYGMKQSVWVAGVVLPLALIAAFVVSLFHSGSYFMPFMAFALVLSAAAIASSFRTDGSLSRFWGTAGTALLLLTLLTFLIAYSKVAANKDVYMNTFITTGLTASVNQLTGMQGSLKAGLSEVSESLVQKVVTKEEIEKIITQEDVDEAMPALSAWASLNESTKNASSAAIRQALIDAVYAEAGKKLKPAVSSVIDEITTAPAQISAPSITPTVKQLLGKIPAFVALYDNFGLLAAMMLASVVAFFGFFIKIISTGVAYLLMKL